MTPRSGRSKTMDIETVDEYRAKWHHAYDTGTEAETQEAYALYVMAAKAYQAATGRRYQSPDLRIFGDPQ